MGLCQLTGAPISHTQQPVVGIEPESHDPETSTDPLCHCADSEILGFGNIELTDNIIQNRVTECSRNVLFVFQSDDSNV